MTKAVLIVIDMQVGSIKPEMQFLVERLASFIPQWIQAGGEVVFSRYINYPGSPCEKYLDWKEMQGPPETDICPELQPYATTVIDKTFYTVLSNEFKEMAAEKNWQTIICCGTDTAACVQKTALDVFDWGRRPYVIADLCASGAGTEAHEAAIIALRRAIGEKQVGTAKEALSLLVA